MDTKHSTVSFLRGCRRNKKIWQKTERIKRLREAEIQKSHQLSYSTVSIYVFLLYSYVYLKKRFSHKALYVLGLQHFSVFALNKWMEPRNISKRNYKLIPPLSQHVLETAVRV